jgi:FKBP12-rapamycin complex-associated protein
VNVLVGSNVLTCLGQLARVGGKDVEEHVPQIMELIIDTLQDPSQAGKRDAALFTLGQMCSNTGYVIDPLLEHPQLLDIMAKILKSDGAMSVKRDTIKVMGILGALDPYRKQVRFSSHHYDSRLTYPLFRSK